LQRLAIISSFYRFAVREDVVARNPIETIKRDRKGKKEAARPMQEQEVKIGLEKIDRSTPVGMRDYALLLVALNTAHRAFELAGIRLKHLHFIGETCAIEWERNKGDKQMDDSLLPAKITHPLVIYLEAIYGTSFQNMSGDTPVWISFSKRNNEQAIGTRTISNVCKAYLGTSKVHATRHTWAKWMMDQNIPLSKIGKGLGHSNLKTTSDYTEELAGYSNPLAEELASAFSLED
jgi:integrase